MFPTIAKPGVFQMNHAVKMSIVALAFTITGCAKSDVPNTVEWYLAHDSERIAMEQVCKAKGHPVSDDCANAQIAAAQLHFKNSKYVNLKPFPADDRKDADATRSEATADK